VSHAAHIVPVASLWSFVRQLLLKISQSFPLLGRKAAVATGLDCPLACKRWHLAQSPHRLLHFRAELRIPLGNGGVRDPWLFVVASILSTDTIGARDATAVTLRIG